MSEGTDTPTREAVEAAVAAAEAWSAQDPDPVTRAALDALLARVRSDAAGAAHELVEAFDGRLAFGTAGLRGELGFGPTRMNRVVVAQAAAGLARHLLSRAGDATPRVVVGYDARHNSERFARDSVELFAGAGLEAILLPRALPTPVLAFAVRHLDAAAGVMVTASHNPARDNGYKVYLGDDDEGSQIVPPDDAAIHREIVAVAEHAITALPRSEAFAIAGESVVDAYVAATAAVAETVAPLSVVYTPMHGVGLDTARRVLAAAGFTAPIVVPEQAEPDPDFPTVAFPNPEEPGALDLALALAAERGADLVLANDPDADRLAVAIPDPDAESGWRQLAGNEVGWLLGWRAARAAAASHEPHDPGSLACSLVSSPALGAVAERFGLRWVETLTGFKWISRAPGLVFGYEEALGYLVNPATVRDKDGISAAVAVLSLAAELAQRGATLGDHLREFAAEIGGYASAQISIRVDDLDDIARMTAALRAGPPTTIGGLPVQAVDDFLRGVGDYPPGDILRFRLAGARVIVRPSGTEPKLKCYLDAWSTEGDAAARLAEARATVARLDAAMRELLV